MARHRTKPIKASDRIARHRSKLEANGIKRVEVAVPPEDAGLIRDLATVLRTGGDEAHRLRENLKPLLHARQARSGRDLVAFFRASPLVGEDLTFERDKSTGRSIDL